MGEEDEAHEVLVEQRLAREGIEVKLDRGFEEGVYCAYVEFDDLAERVGFTAGCRRAGEFCTLLKAELACILGHSLGETEDASHTDDQRRKRDLELTYLMFPVTRPDGRFDDTAMKEEFRLALLRAGQRWDQAQARAGTQRRTSRRDAFRRQLGELLSRDAFAGLDEATRARLLEEIPALAFPGRGIAP